MKPHRVKMAHSLIVHYGLASHMEVRVVCNPAVASNTLQASICTTLVVHLLKFEE